MKAIELMGSAKRQLAKNPHFTNNPARQVHGQLLVLTPDFGS